MVTNFIACKESNYIDDIRHELGLDWFKDHPVIEGVIVGVGLTEFVVESSINDSYEGLKKGLFLALGCDFERYEKKRFLMHGYRRT